MVLNRRIGRGALVGPVWEPFGGPCASDVEMRSINAAPARDLSKARNPSGLLVVKLGDLQRLGEFQGPGETSARSRGGMKELMGTEQIAHLGPPVVPFLTLFWGRVPLLK